MFMFHTFIGFEPITLNFREPFKHSWKPNSLQCNWKVKTKAKIAKWSEKKNRIKTMMRETAGVDKYLWPRIRCNSRFSIHSVPRFTFIFLLQYFKAIFIRRFKSEFNFLKLFFSTHFKKMKGSKEDVGRCFCSVKLNYFR
jgi:hypothetical protein